jgi:phage gp46-like protein
MDIALVPTAGYGFDFALTPAGTDLAGDGALDTAIYLSLFTDRLANEDDAIPDGTGDRRGTWMDVPIDGSAPVDLMGSRLWLLRRAKATQETLLNAVAYVEEALQWLTDDGVAASVAVTGAYQISGSGVADMLALSIVITRQKSGAAANDNYALVWRNSLSQPPVLMAA